MDGGQAGERAGRECVSLGRFFVWWGTGRGEEVVMGKCDGHADEERPTTTKTLLGLALGLNSDLASDSDRGNEEGATTCAGVWAVCRQAAAREGKMRHKRGSPHARE